MFGWDSPESTQPATLIMDGPYGHLRTLEQATLFRHDRRLVKHRVARSPWKLNGLFPICRCDRGPVTSAQINPPTCAAHLCRDEHTKRDP